MPLRSLTTVPPGGWRLQQTLADGSTKKWASMGLLWELATQIADFRTGNGLPNATAKEVVHEIEEQTCARLHDDPAWCVAEKKSPRAALSQRFANAVRAAAGGSRILVEWLGDGMKPVPIAIAMARVNVCRTCPENKLGHSFLKLTADTVRAIADQLRAKEELKIRFADEEALGTCRVCGCVIRLKALVPLETILKHLDEETLRAFPPACWIPTERQSL